MAKARDKKARKGKRYKVRDFQVDYTADNLFSFLRRASSEKQPLVDMSTSGLQFLSRKKLKIGESIKLTISAPLFASPIKAKGKVVWSQQIPRQTLYRTGVALQEVDEEVEKRLAGFEEKVQQLTIRVLCNSCGSAFKVKKKHEGGRGKCPNCKKTIEIVDAVPAGGQAKSGVHVSASAIGGGADGAGGAEGADGGGGASTSGLPQNVRRFLIKTCPTRKHLALLEYMVNNRATVFGPASLAKVLGESAKSVTALCADMETRGVLKPVGVKTFNYSPPAASKKVIDEIMRLSRDRRRRPKILAFVLANEKKRG